MATKSALGSQAMPRETAQPALAHVDRPGGGRLTLADLPLPDTKRWVIRRKAEIVAAIRGGLLSLEEACSRYNLSPAEILSWQRCIDRFGIAGLRTTWTQVYLGRRARARYLDYVEPPSAEAG
jgi:hypothetical protein